MLQYVKIMLQLFHAVVKFRSANRLFPIILYVVLNSLGLTFNTMNSINKLEIFLLLLEFRFFYFVKKPSAMDSSERDSAKLQRSVAFSIIFPPYIGNISHYFVLGTNFICFTETFSEVATV